MVVGRESGKAGVADAATKKKKGIKIQPKREKTEGKDQIIHLTPSYLNRA